MSYASIGPAVYEVYQPETPWHIGAKGWYSAPVPGWGQNPNLLDRYRYAVQGLGCGGGCGCSKSVGQEDQQETNLLGYVAVAGLLGLAMLTTMSMGGQRRRS